MEENAQAVGAKESTIHVEERPPLDAEPLWREYVSTSRLNSDKVEDCETYSRYLKNSTTGEKFVDESFPAAMSSIRGYVNGESSNSSLANVTDFVEENQVQWLRIPDIVENVSYVRFTWHRNLNKDGDMITNLLNASPDDTMRVAGMSTMTLKEVEYKKQRFAMDDSWDSVRHTYMDIAKAAVLSGMVGQIDACSKLFNTHLKTWCLGKQGSNKNTNGFNFFNNIKSQAFPCKFARDITVAYFYAEFPMDRHNAQLSGEFANGLHIPTVEDKALVHVICAIHFNPGPKCLFADEYTNKSIAEFFENDHYAPHLFDEKNHLFDALGCLVSASTFKNAAGKEDGGIKKNASDTAQYHCISKRLFPKVKKVRENMSVFEDQKLNPNGIYLVELFYGNAKRLVLVDDQIPCDIFGMPLFTKPLKPLKERKLKSFVNPSLPCPTEYWPLLVEKAYAKLHGSYHVARFQNNNTMGDVTTASSLLHQKNNVGSKMKMAKLCKSLNSLSGGVSTTFQWNRKTGRGYRDGMLEWFVPPSTASEAGSFSALAKLAEDRSDSEDMEDGQTKDGGDNELHDAILKNAAIDFETQTTDEENARILFRRLRTIAIGEENMDTIFVVKRQNEDEDEDLEDLDENDTDMYLVSNLLNQDRDSMSWVLEDPNALNSRQSFVAKLRSPLVTLTRPWSPIQHSDENPEEGTQKGMDQETQVVRISMVELYKKFRAITVHHICSNHLAAESNAKEQFKHHLTINGAWGNSDRGHTSPTNPQYHIFVKSPCNAIIAVETLEESVKRSRQRRRSRSASLGQRTTNSPLSSPNSDEFEVLPTPDSVGLLLEKRVPLNANEFLQKKRFQIGLGENRVENGLRYSKYGNQSYLSVSLDTTLVHANLFNDGKDDSSSANDENFMDDMPYILVPVSMAQAGSRRRSGKYVLSIFSSSELVVKELLNLEKGGFKYCLATNGIVGKKVGRTGRLMSPLNVGLKKSRNANDDSQHGGNYPDYKSWWLNPQYEFEVQNNKHSAGDGNKTEVLVVLSNKTEVSRRRTSMLSATPKSKSSSADEIVGSLGRPVWPGMGFLVAKSIHGHIIRFLPGSIYIDLVKGNSVPTISKILYLENGKYILIPFGSDPSVAYEFSLSVFSNENLRRNSLILLKDWNSHICWKSHWIKGFCGGCCNHKKSWLENPTATFQVFMNEDKKEDKDCTDEDLAFLDVSAEPPTCTVHIQILQKHLGQTPIGFFLYSGYPPYNPNRYPPHVAKFIGDPWIQNRFEGKLTSGPYTIVAQTFDQNILGDFIVHIYSDDGELVADRCIGRNGGAGGQWIKNERKQYVCL